MRWSGQGFCTVVLLLVTGQVWSQQIQAPAAPVGKGQAYAGVAQIVPVDARERPPQVRLEPVPVTSCVSDPVKKPTAKAVAPPKSQKSFQFMEWLQTLVHRLLAPDPRIKLVTAGPRYYPDQSSRLGPAHFENWPPAHYTLPANQPGGDSKVPLKLAPTLEYAPEIAPPAPYPERLPDEVRRRGDAPTSEVIPTRHVERRNEEQGTRSSARAPVWETPFALPPLLTVADLKSTSPGLAEESSGPASQLPGVRIAAALPTSRPLFKSPDAPVPDASLLEHNTRLSAIRIPRPLSSSPPATAPERPRLFRTLPVAILGASLLAAILFWVRKRQSPGGLPSGPG